MKKLIIPLIAILLFSSCASLDVVQTDAIRAFNKIPSTDPNAIFASGSTVGTGDNDTASINWNGQGVFFNASFGGKTLTFSLPDGGNTAEEIIPRNRHALMYHSDTDCYSLTIGTAMFMWGKSDIYMAFVLDPASVPGDGADGWEYKQIDGAWKFVKEFDFEEQL